MDDEEELDDGKGFVSIVGGINVDDVTILEDEVAPDCGFGAVVVLVGFEINEDEVDNEGLALFVELAIDER